MNTVGISKLVEARAIELPKIVNKKILNHALSFESEYFKSEESLYKKKIDLSTLV